MDELGARAAALAARHPRHARLRRVGTSRAGTPLLLLSVGHGSRHALVVAGPHANEPVGGATVLRLAERALADPRLTEGADATWNLLLCADPDGLRRNEGWLSGPYTLDRYARNFFRPGFLEQPEWLPDGPDHAALPETRTLLALQDELRPFLQCSLHGVDVGGGFVEVTHDLPGLAQRIAHTAARLGVPRELGAYDTLYWPGLGPAVYRIPPPRLGDLTAAITEAAVDSTWCHPQRYGTVTAVVEAPMWGVAAVSDGSPPADRDGVLRAVSRSLRDDTRRLRRVLARVRPHLATDPDAAHLLAPVDDYLLVCPRLADAWDPDTDDGTGRSLPPMSNAHLVALRLAGRRLSLRTAGLLHQLVTRTGGDPAGVLPEVERLVDEGCADYRDGCAARWIPVARQVEYQTRVVLAAFELAGRRPTAGSRSGEPGWGPGAAVPMHRE
ncbi:MULTISPECIES: M14 family zinc carboxypeptidase [Streptomyces]|uniref:M14 family zinc carboxypeptidase n=2 Tax=Streptomyces rochei group TaxID=2867164 RepID=A0AAX3ZPQ5_STRRO|nr:MULTISPECIES: M14 family zinc carboxypeptidase [Streptomyces]KYK14759.1 dehydrogenase [Streptomyces sp. CC71]MBQ0882380.1 dehydrogenase [Streptomyces sp. RT42]MBQ0913279.1 dehydrogenase [Streptomyces sp. RM99]MBU8552532.1 dehydrogenase [Streptomyces sp. Osf17]MBU8559326.1 dehydrogenase [Streptomyces sp. Babs14]